MAKTIPLIFIPTYNERENVQRLCADILKLGLDVDILIMDDNSPDGTGQIIDELARKSPHVFASHRPKKLGIGRAHRDGINWAYQQGYTQLITMDCDFTHPPSCIPEIIEVAQASNADVIVGSRYLRRDSLSGWNPLRLFSDIHWSFPNQDVARNVPRRNGRISLLSVGSSSAAFVRSRPLYWVFLFLRKSVHTLSKRVYNW